METIKIVVTVAALALVIYSFYFIYLGFFKKKPISKLSEEKPKRLEQNKINTNAVGKIIRGHYDKLLDSTMNYYIEAFDKWQNTQFELFKEASDKNRKMFFKIKNGNNPYECESIYSQEKPSTDYELFMEDSFTEPFPSLHDLDDFARNDFLCQILLLKDIHKEESKDYYFFEKFHFVNHEMVQAIIVIDIYKKKI